MAKARPRTVPEAKGEAVPAAPAREGLRERNKRDKRDRIVAAADELFRSQGFDETTGRQICERAGIGTGTLFLYVRDKRELLFLIFEPLAAEAFRSTPADLGARETLAGGLLRLFGAFFDLYGRHPVLARLFMQELFFRPDPGPGMTALNAELRRRIERLVEQARQRGAVRSDVPSLAVAATMSAHYVYWLQLWIGLAAVSQREALAGLRRALDLAIEGVAARPGGKR